MSSTCEWLTRWCWSDAGAGGGAGCSDEALQQVAVVRPRTRTSFAGLSRTEREQLHSTDVAAAPLQHDRPTTTTTTTTTVDSRQRQHASEYDLRAHKSVRMSATLSTRCHSRTVNRLTLCRSAYLYAADCWSSSCASDYRLLFIRSFYLLPLTLLMGFCFHHRLSVCLSVCLFIYLVC